MAINKIVLNTETGEQTLVDLTGDTVTPETLAEGTTAHSANGEQITGVAPVDAVRYSEQSLTDEQKAQARENIGAAAVGEGGAISWNDIADNPFGGGSNSISWASAGIDYNSLPEQTWVKVSDAVVTAADVADLTASDPILTYLTAGYGSVSVYGTNDIGYNPILVNDNDITLVAVDMNTGDNLEVVKFLPDGVFFFTGWNWDEEKFYPISVTIPHYGKFTSIKPIDSRYLPEGLQVETVGMTDMLTVNALIDAKGQIDSAVATGKEWYGAAYKVSDVDLPMASFDIGNGRYQLAYSENTEWYGICALEAILLENGMYDVTFTDEWGNTNHYGFYIPDGLGYDRGLYVDPCDHFNWQFSLPVFESRTPKTIDPKYLPEGIGGGVSAEEVDTLISNKGYQTEEQVNALINTALGVIENGTY